MEKCPVKRLSKIAGASVRTLHDYDRIGLLKPLFRTAAGYRLYGPQKKIAHHYAFILKFLGKTGNQAEGYRGLGNLYAHDQRYTTVNGLPSPAFGEFMQEAIVHFVARNLQ